MCRLLGFAAPEPTTFAEVVGARECADFQELARLHADGWGVAWVRECGRRRSLSRFRAHFDGRDDENLRRCLTRTSARVGLAHLRLATGGLDVTVANNHPFVHGGIALAHNGSIEPVPRLRSLVPTRALAAVQGTTDSELYLALVRDRWDDGVGLVEAVSEVVEMLRPEFPTASLNAMVATREEFVVVRASTDAAPPLDHFAAWATPGQDLPLHHDEDYYRMSYTRLPGGAVAFASSGIDLPHWEDLPPDTVAGVDLATMRLQVVPLRHGSPTRPARPV